MLHVSRVSPYPPELLRLWPQSARVAPFGENATEFSEKFADEFKEAINAPDDTFQTCKLALYTPLRLLPEAANLVPSGENATDETWPWVIPVLSEPDEVPVETFHSSNTPVVVPVAVLRPWPAHAIVCPFGENVAE